MAWEIYDGKDTRGLITLYGYPHHKGDCFAITTAPIGAWSKDEIEDFTSYVYFHRTRESWKAAYRVARLISQSSPRLRAVLSSSDLTACATVEISMWHWDAVSLPMVVVEGKEVA